MSKSNHTFASQRDARLEAWIAGAEKHLRANATDLATIKRLTMILQNYAPKGLVPGPYSLANAEIAKSASEFGGLRAENEIVEAIGRWQAILNDQGVTHRVPIAQVVRGVRPLRVLEPATTCGMLLGMFEKTGAISEICQGCYKVQALPRSVLEMACLHFLFMEIDLPSDATRKCMIELRPQFKYPYKGYVYCISEDEAQDCAARLRNAIVSTPMEGMRIAITHGCSEYAAVHPEFRFSEDGAHRAFSPPDAWKATEAAYRKKLGAKSTPPIAKNFNGVSLADAMAIGTWVEYARHIGDETGVRLDPGGVRVLPKVFHDRIRAQADARRAQLAELQA